MPAPRIILYPTDFSGPSMKSFQVAGSLARDRNAALLVLHVVPKPLTTLGGTQGLPPSREEFDVEGARKQLAEIRAPEGVSMTTRLEIGDEADIILNVAKQIGAELIVMGTHGRTGINRLIMGSVAEKVVRGASCPVLTLRSDLPPG